MLLASVMFVLIHYVAPMRIIIAAILAVGSLPCLVFPTALLLIFLRERRPEATLGPLDLAILWLIGMIFWALAIPEWMLPY